MGNRTATIYTNVKTDGVWKFFRPVETNNHELKEGYALVKGRARRFEPPDYKYYISWYEGGKKKFQRVDGDQTVARNLRVSKERELGNKALQTTPAPGRKAIAQAITKFLGEKKNHSHKTQIGYKHNLNLFQQSCTKTHLDELTREDMLAFVDFLVGKGYSKRTQFNIMQSINTFLKEFDIEKLLPRKKWPKFVEKIVKVYEEEQLQTLFAAADPEEWLLFQFLLGTGFREQEAAHAAYRDCIFSNSTIAVTTKPDFGFEPKDKEERVVPIPRYLTQALMRRHKENKDALLVFPNADGRPNGHFLRILKNLALRAKLNCGHCKNKAGESCKLQPVCAEWLLHRFRKTFATRMYKACRDARKVQFLLGHSDLETTERYLKDVKLETVETSGEVEQAFAMFAR
jgi:integrase/recombinase XerD